MPNSVGSRTPCDKLFAHQVAETFASVTSDPAWTEQVPQESVSRTAALQVAIELPADMVGTAVVLKPYTVEQSAQAWIIWAEK